MHRLIRFFTFICSLFFMLTVRQPLRASGTWEFSPYRVHVWVQLEQSPHLTEQLQRDVSDYLHYGVLAAVDYGWQLSVDAAPLQLSPSIHQGMETLPFDSLAGGKPPHCDKLFLLQVKYRQGEYRIAVQEWDMPTRLSTAPLQFTTQQRDAVPNLCLQAILDSFRPIVRIERVEAREITARIRAAGLVTTDKSLLLVEKGMILHPVIRRNQRNGEPIPNGIQNPAWTYLSPESREQALVKCKLNTAYAAVVPTKGGQRLERFALLVQRRFPQTEIVVRTKKEAATKEKTTAKRATAQSRPLPDYEIYSKEPEASETSYIGLTDWRGSLRLKVDEQPLHLLYVRNGGQFLARLPVVVGEHASVAVEVFDDDPRMLAESKIRSLQSRLMDTEARRELLAMRIRAQLDNRKYDEADKLLDQLKLLPQRNQLTRELEDMKRNTPPAQGTTKTRVEKLFNDANRLLIKFLNPELPNQLQKEIDAARSSLRPSPSKNADDSSKAGQKRADDTEEKSSAPQPMSESKSTPMPAS